MNGLSRKVRLEYDGRSRPRVIRYPALATMPALAVQYDYDTDSGALVRLRSADEPRQIYFERVASNGFGQVTEERYGSALTRIRSYEAKSGRLKTLDATGSDAAGVDKAKSLVARTYTYRPDGTLQSELDRTGSSKLPFRRYDYDASQRLVEVLDSASPSGTPQQGQWFRYDGQGRLAMAGVREGTVNRPTQEYRYEAGSHRLTSLVNDRGETARFTYARTGAMITRSAAHAAPAFEAEYASHSGDLPTVLHSDGGQVRYRYDGFGRRVFKEVSGGTQTVYVGDDLYQVRETNGAVTQHILLQSDEGVVAEILRRATPANDSASDSGASTETSKQTLYHLRDRLGSTEVLANAQGKLVERRRYDAWGMPLAAGGDAEHDTSQLSYTGHIYEAEAGLIHMQGRLYDPVSRRMLSPDPIVADPFEPLDQDPYAYVRNNPLRYVDPTGLFGEEPPPGPGGGIGCTQDFCIPEGDHGWGAGPPQEPDPAQTEEERQYEQEQARRRLQQARSEARRKARAAKLRPIDGYYELGGALQAGSETFAPAHSGTETPLAEGGPPPVGIGLGSDPWGEVLKAHEGFRYGEETSELYKSFFLETGLFVAGMVVGPETWLLRVPWVRTLAPRIPLLRGMVASRGAGTVDLGPVLMPGLRLTVKAVNLPAWRKLSVDMVHIAERHIAGGPFTAGRTVFPSTMNQKGVVRAIREAYKSSTKVGSQGADRVLLQGQGAGLQIEMWLNKATNVIETAYPIVR